MTGKDGAKGKLFISYSRKDMSFADKLETALAVRGFQVLIDRTEIYAFEDWWKRIETLITKADTVVVILSPDSVTFHVALKEISFAATLNKRFAPIAPRRIEDSALPDVLRRLNIIFFDSEAKFESNIQRLGEALDTDIDWVRKHTDFGEQAQRWLAAGRPGPRGLLLRSPSLEEAERWIAARPANAPLPTEATQSFVAESRKAATRRRNVLSASLAAGMMVAFSLAALAYWQRGVAIEQRGIAVVQRDQAWVTQSRFLADLSRQFAERGDQTTAALLSLEALPDATVNAERPLVKEAEDALYQSSSTVREIAVVAVPDTRIKSMELSPDARRILTIQEDQTIRVWEAGTLALITQQGPFEMGKWPYQDQAWKAWLKYQRAGLMPPLPTAPEWKTANYDLALRFDPNSAEAYFGRGNAYFAEKHYEKALHDYGHAIRLDPSKAGALASRSKGFFDQKDFAQVIALEGILIKLNPHDVSSYDRRGRAHVLMREYDNAIADFGEIIKLNPRGSSAYAVRADAFNKKGDFDRAIADSNEAVQLDANNASAFGIRGDAFTAKGDHAKAIDDFAEALRLDPKDYNALPSLSFDHMQRGAYARAIALYNEQIRQWPDNGIALVYRGNCFWGLGDPDRAIVDYDRAIKVDPRDATAFLNRAGAYSDKGQLDRAMHDYDQVIEIVANGPATVHALRGRGLIHAQSKQYDRAIAEFDRAIKLSRTEVDVFTYRGMAHLAKGQYEQAISDATDAISMNSKNAQAFGLRGSAYEHKNDLARSIADFSSAIRLQPAARYFDGRCWARAIAGELQDALADCNEALRLEPNRPEALDSAA